MSHSQPNDFIWNTIQSLVSGFSASDGQKPVSIPAEPAFFHAFVNWGTPVLLLVFAMNLLRWCFRIGSYGFADDFIDSFAKNREAKRQDRRESQVANTGLSLTKAEGTAEGTHGGIQAFLIAVGEKLAPSGK